MKRLFDLCLARFLRPGRVLAYLGAVGAVQAAIVMSSAPAFTSAAMSLSARSDSFVSVFLTTAFTWTLGLPLAAYIGILGTGAVSGEMSDGTMLALVTGPLSRGRILAAKYLALGISAFALSAVSLLLMLTAGMVLAGAAPEMATDAAAYLPALAAYSVIVILLFSALTVLLATLFKGKTGPAVTAAVIAMLVYAIAPYIRSFFSEAGYEWRRLYLFDFNYQLGIVFDSVMRLFQARGGMPPEARALLGLVTGAYDDAGEARVLIRPAAVASAMGVIAAAFLLAAFRIFKKKDVT